MTPKELAEHEASSLTCAIYDWSNETYLPDQDLIEERLSRIIATARAEALDEAAQLIEARFAIEPMEDTPGVLMHIRRTAGSHHAAAIRALKDKAND